VTTVSQRVAPAMTDKWATFRLMNELFALRVADVQEVMMFQQLTPVPLAPPHIIGLLNLRGQIMAAVDLRRRLQFPDRAEGASSSMIVLKAHGAVISLVVDEIGDVLELPAANWRDPPDTLAIAHRAFIVGICPIDGDVVLGLNVEELIGDEDRPSQGARRQ